MYLTFDVRKFALHDLYFFSDLINCLLFDKTHKNCPQERETVWRKEPPECTDCGRECNYVNLLMAHVKIKHQLKRFNCETCDVKYKTESALLLHKFKEHGQKLAIICPICYRVFNKVFTTFYNHSSKEHQDQSNTEEYKTF